MATQLRLLWRMHRWESTFLVGGALLLSVALVIVGWQIGASRDTVLACYEQPYETLSAACRSAIDWGNTLSGAVGILVSGTTVAPFAAGIFLGAPLLSREIEHRTAPMAWSLSPSRGQWLLWRTVPLLLVLGFVLLVLGQASAFLLDTIEEVDLGFRQYGMFGPILPARGLAIFGVGVLVGLVVGRVLPALLVTALATVAIVGGMSIGRDLLMRQEAIWLPMGDQSDFVHMVFDSGFRSEETGEIIGYEQAYSEYPDSFDEMTGEGGPPGMTSVWKIVPPQAFDLYVVREIGALVTAFVVLGAGSLFIVHRRRPD
jgi:hypothetical protein